MTDQQPPVDREVALVEAADVRLLDLRPALGEPAGAGDGDGPDPLQHHPDLALDHEPVAIGDPPREADAGADREPLPLALEIPLVGAVGPRAGRPHRQHPRPVAGPLRVAGCPAPEYHRLSPPRRDLLGPPLSAEDGRHASRHGAEPARSGTGTAGLLGVAPGPGEGPDCWRRRGAGLRRTTRTGGPGMMTMAGSWPLRKEKPASPLCATAGKALGARMAFRVGLGK